MANKVGYKQCKEYFNCVPELNSTIDTLSSIGMCRYNPEAKKTSDINLFMTYPVKYFFNVNVKMPKLASLFQHSCYFDSKEEAEKNHRELRLKFYDQKTKQYLKKLSKGKPLDLNEQEAVLKIIDEIETLKN